MYLFTCDDEKKFDLGRIAFMYEDGEMDRLEYMIKNLMEPKLAHELALGLMAASFSKENIGDEDVVMRYSRTAAFFERIYLSLVQKTEGNTSSDDTGSSADDEQCHGYDDGYEPDKSWYDGRDENETYKELVRIKEELDEERKRELELEWQEAELDEIAREEEYENEVAAIQKQYQYPEEPYDNESLSDFERRAKNYDAEFYEE